MDQTKENAKVIKKILSNLFGYQNVTVRKGSGTATGWITAHVNLFKDEYCTCEETLKVYGYPKTCPSCKQQMAGAHTRFNDARGNYKLDLYTYSDDMGGENECFNLSFRVS